jgi:antitoxin HicB
MARKKSAHRTDRSAAQSPARRAAREAAIALRIKRELAADLSRMLEQARLSQSELARRMRTSRAVVHRLLKGDDPSVTLATISRAAVALGCTVKVTLRN